MGSCCSREELLHKVSPAVMKAIHDNPITLANLAEIRSSGDSGSLAASNRLFSLDESVQELASLKDGGGLIVLECSSAIGDGRDPSGLAEISRRSGVSIVMAASAKEVGMCSCRGVSAFATLAALGICALCSYEASLGNLCYSVRPRPGRTLPRAQDAVVKLRAERRQPQNSQGTKHAVLSVHVTVRTNSFGKKRDKGCQIPSCSS